MPKWDLIPSGHLILWLGDPQWNGRRFKDGKRQRIEDILNAFLMALVEWSLRLKAERERQLREEAAHQEAEDRRVARERTLREEEARVARFERLAMLWRRNHDARAFLAAVRPALESVAADSELARWLAWAPPVGRAGIGLEHWRW